MATATRARHALLRPRRGARAALLSLACPGLLVGGLLVALPGRADGSKEAPKGPGGAPAASAPGVHLDQLLKLPSDRSYTIDKRGGLSRGEWQQRFKEIRDLLAAQKKALAAAESKMDEVARGTNPWKVGPTIPGMSNTSDAPLDYRLQREIKQRRRLVRQLEEQLRQLGIKADLAGVPEDWRS